jgi:hypothetical protein
MTAYSKRVRSGSLYLWVVLKARYLQQELLTRNYQPYSYIDLEREAEVQDLLDRFQVAIDELPVLICRRGIVLRNPSNQEIVNCLGFLSLLVRNDAICVARTQSVLVPLL